VRIFGVPDRRVADGSGDGGLISIRAGLRWSGT
jgi:hypothetical protein